MCCLWHVNYTSVKLFVKINKRAVRVQKESPLRLGTAESLTGHTYEAQEDLGKGERRRNSRLETANKGTDEGTLLQCLASQVRQVAEDDRRGPMCPLQELALPRQAGAGSEA